MFKSVASANVAAKRLLVDYAAWVADGAERVLSSRGTNAPSVQDLGIVAARLASFRTEAGSIRDDASFDELPSSVRDDIVSLFEEADVAIEEIEAMNDPDAVWDALPREQKRALLATMRHTPVAADLVKSRLKHEIRKQNGGERVRVVAGRVRPPGDVVVLRDKPAKK